MNLDKDCETPRKGRPFSLICTKNTASHTRALQTRTADQELANKLAKLDHPLPTPE